MLALCLALRDEYNIAVVTNDIFTKYVKSLFLLVITKIQFSLAGS